MDEGRKRVIGVMAAILANLHIFLNEEVGHFHQLPADFTDWEARMSIQATAVVKKETKVDPKKPADKVHYASLRVLNEDGKEYGCHVIWVGSVKLRFCSNVKRELHTNNYTSVLPRTKGAKKSVFL